MPDGKEQDGGADNEYYDVVLDRNDVKKAGVGSKVLERREFRGQHRGGVVDAVHQHREFQRACLVIDVAEEASDDERGESLPEIAVDDREEDRRDGYRQRWTHPSSASVLARLALAGVVQQASQHYASAQPLLKDRSEHAHTQ